MTGFASSAVHGLEPIAVQTPLAECLAGTRSPAMTVMELLCLTEDADLVRRLVTAVSRRVPAGDATRAQVDALERLLDAHAGGCDRIAEMLRSGVDSSAAAPTVDAGLAFVERLFDWSVEQSEEASVALYSLGSPAVLADATAEVVSLLSSWGVLAADRTVLQIGCGIGRFEVAIAPLVREAIGLDLSGKMIAAAARRCNGLPNVRLLKTDGRDLASMASGSVDLVYAVDTFPYLVQAGREIVATHVAESRRVLRPGGELVILNFSYRDDLAADRVDVCGLAETHGFTVLVAGAQPFRLWNGAVFRLRRVPE